MSGNSDHAARQVTMLIENAAAGDSRAASDLLPLIYDELRKLAASNLGKEHSPANTLQPTALVHEAYLRLLGLEGGWVKWLEQSGALLWCRCDSDETDSD